MASESPLSFKKLSYKPEIIDGIRSPELHKLIEFGKREKMISFIKRAKNQSLLNESINVKSGSGKTALHVAASVGDHEGTKILLENGAEIEAIDKNGETPLHSTARYASYKVMKLLLQHNSNVNAQSNSRQTPLHLAVKGLSTQNVSYKVRGLMCIRLLISFGADPRLKNDANKTAREEIDELVSLFYTESCKTQNENVMALLALSEQVFRAKVELEKRLKTIEEKVLNGMAILEVGNNPVASPNYSDRVQIENRILKYETEMTKQSKKLSQMENKIVLLERYINDDKSKQRMIAKQDGSLANKILLERIDFSKVVHQNETNQVFFFNKWQWILCATVGISMSVALSVSR